MLPPLPMNVIKSDKTAEIGDQYDHLSTAMDDREGWTKNVIEI